MATPTWDQFTFLTPAQQNKAAQFEAIGIAWTLWKQGKGPPPDYSTVTYSQTKAADAMLRSAIDRLGPAQRGVNLAKAKYEADALAAYQAANP